MLRKRYSIKKGVTELLHFRSNGPLPKRRPLEGSVDSVRKVGVGETTSGANRCATLDDDTYEVQTTDDTVNDPVFNSTSEYQLPPNNGHLVLVGKVAAVRADVLVLFNTFVALLFLQLLFGFPRSGFPNLPLIRDRGVYAQDLANSNQKSCTKNYLGHPNLVSGIFTVYCVHGVNYGYEVMESFESPNTPFTIFKTRFPVAPDIIIYDNACSLKEYALNCDPLLFRRTKFLVDRFHWKNHTGCSLSYKLSMYPQLQKINSQVNEQQNASTKHLRTQLSYMNPDNFMKHVTFFL